MTDYTLGFIFNQTLDKVLLIHKLSPEWQRGKVNGIAGKVEPGESGVDCIAREVREESGLDISPADWKYMGKMQGDEWVVEVFSIVYSGGLEDAQSTNKEEIGWFEVGAIPSNAIPNLHWLIPMALDKITNKHSPQSFAITYE